MAFGVCGNVTPHGWQQVMPCQPTAAGACTRASARQARARSHLVEGRRERLRNQVHLAAAQLAVCVARSSRSVVLRYVGGRRALQLAQAQLAAQLQQRRSLGRAVLRAQLEGEWRGGAGGRGPRMCHHACTQCAALSSSPVSVSARDCPADLQQLVDKARLAQLSQPAWLSRAPR